MFRILFSIFYWICFIYFIFCECTYMYFRLRKDERFKNIGFFKYIEKPIKTLKGE